MTVLNVFIDDQLIPVKVPQFILDTGREFFDKLDADMNRGWQMARSWVEQPNLEQRCQIVADRMLTAIENENPKVASMMAGYILVRAPAVRHVRVATNGEIQETELLGGNDEVVF
ncbi:MAG: hypothetical protein ACFCUJ_02245 [Thiotrichales bacterium]